MSRFLRLIERIAKPLPIQNNMQALGDHYDVDRMNLHVDDLEQVFRTRHLWKES